MVDDQQVSAVGFALVGTRLMTEVRYQLYKHVQSLSLGFHTKSRAGDMLIRGIGDVGMMRDVAVTALMPLLANVLILSGMLLVMSWMNWQLTLAGLAVIGGWAWQRRRRREDNEQAVLR